MSETGATKNYKDTLNLPQTEFPMKADLAKREPDFLARWDQQGIYQQIQESRKSAPKYILHDGPPFANGDVHVGTALNKILKDFILKYKSMAGYQVPYVPGWDCHGLPIEYKVLRDLGPESAKLSPAEIRQKCQAFAEKYITIQREQFKRLGVFGEWEDPYLTMKEGYEAAILEVFAAFVEQGLVYRGKKPVYWSIPVRSALAEAEVEYQDHVSPSIWVKFRFTKTNQPELLNAYAVIWTTTPWTLPANLAIAVHPNYTYVAAKFGEEIYLVAEGLLEKFTASTKLPSPEVLGKYRGEDLNGAETAHPFIQRKSPLVLADYVTLESGTGMVHTAPGHGLEDYETGLKYHLDIYCPVNDEGRFDNDGSVPAELAGKSVLEKKDGGSEANEAVLTLLRSKNALVHQERYSHTYPFCWRSKTPVVFRAVEQWFVKLDHAGLRQRVLEQVAKTKWVPDWGKNRITGAVQARPDWCISRQRTWGVPIPAFYDENRKPLLNGKIIRCVADLFRKHGSNIWFEKSAGELWNLLGQATSEFTVSDPAKLTKSNDTLDVWIDSGSSHTAVLRQHPALSFPADIYLEGSDQHRGWFQSSLWTSTVVNGQSPFRQVLTHGFIVDLDGKKISKSGTYQKPQDAMSYIKIHGADVLRLWVSSQDYRNDIPVSDEIFTHISEAYKKIRNTIRFLLSNLYDFNPGKHAVVYAGLEEVDRWILSKLAHLVEQVREAYEEFEFHRVYQLINQFCTVELSAFYGDMLKDRLYTFAADAQERRSSQTAFYELVSVISRMMAPILPFTSEEIWQFMPAAEGQHKKSIHLQPFPQTDPSWYQPELETRWEQLKDVRSKVAIELEKSRQLKLIGKNLDAKVELGSGKPEVAALLSSYEKFLHTLFNVSQVTIHQSAPGVELDVKVAHADGEKCVRCWNWSTLTNTFSNHPGLCERCVPVVEQTK